jgi:hypothetical protein
MFIHSATIALMSIMTYYPGAASILSLEYGLSKVMFFVSMTIRLFSDMAFRALML